jgi:hypothetical protein
LSIASSSISFFGRSVDIALHVFENRQRRKQRAVLEQDTRRIDAKTLHVAALRCRRRKA